MKYVAALLTALLVGCANQDSPHPNAPPVRAAAAYETTTNVLAEPLSGRRVKISVTAHDDSLYIVNCNEHIVVSLMAVGSQDVAWGGASNACLSQSIIIPAKATLSFVIALNDGSPELDTSVSYTAFVGDVHQSSDIRSPQVAVERMISNSFKLIP
jgi:hypothetical protein